MISITDLNSEDILQILQHADQIKQGKSQDHLQGKILASCFFDPSTRTRLSFESAMLKLGGQVIGFSDGAVTSSKKGESLTDSIRIIGAYADVIVLRHPLDGAARCAAEATSTPVINAGDGSNQHPTQTLLDLFTIKECQGKLTQLHIACVGDLKYGRTVHSLALAAAFFDMRLYFLSPEHLSLPEDICHVLRKKGIKFSFHRTIEEIINKLDILYMTRIQKERLDPTLPQMDTPYILKPHHLTHAKKNLKILHPLPRVNEIDPEIDHTPYAYYFQQAQNGLPVRQAVLIRACQTHR